jgi:hypothetical protein
MLTPVDIVSVLVRYISRLMPEFSHGETRYFRCLGPCMITEISKVSKGWRHCASTSAAAPHTSMLKKTVIWFISFVWLSETNQINQINKTNQIDLTYARRVGYENSAMGNGCSAVC